MTRGGKRRAGGLVLLALVTVAGCGKPAQTSAPPPRPAATVEPAGRGRSEAFIAAGNEAYRAGEFELALKRYAAAAVADPRDPAAYFGMGMSFTRLKREDEARAAYARAQQLSREAAESGKETPQKNR